MGDAVGQRIEVTLGVFAMLELAGEPIFRNKAWQTGQKLEYAAHEMGVFGGRNIAVIRQLADRPEEFHFAPGFREFGHVGIANYGFQRLDIGARLGAGEAILPGHGSKAAAQALQGAKIKVRVAPLQRTDSVEVMVLKAVDGFLVKSLRFTGAAEGAVIHVAAGAAGDLAELAGAELAVLEAIELSCGGKGYVIDIHVEAHADGIGCHDVIHVTGLIEGDLGVAGARRQGAQDHGCTAILPPDEFGHGIDHFGRESDNGGPSGKPGHFLDAGIGELGKARPGDEAGLGQHDFKNGFHGGSAEKHGFLGAPPVQNPVGENVAALEICAKLNLVDGEKRHLDVGRHGLDGCHPIARGSGDDFFLAGHQGHGVVTGPQPHPVIDFAGQKPERQADHAAAMGQHALHRQMGFAGIGGAQYGGDIADLRHPHKVDANWLMSTARIA